MAGFTRQESYSGWGNSDQPQSTPVYSEDVDGGYDNMAEIKDYLPESDGRLRKDSDSLPDEPVPRRRLDSFAGFGEESNDYDDEEEELPQIPTQPPAQNRTLVFNNTDAVARTTSNTDFGTTIRRKNRPASVLHGFKFEGDFEDDVDVDEFQYSIESTYECVPDITTVNFPQSDHDRQQNRHQIRHQNRDGDHDREGDHDHDREEATSDTLQATRTHGNSFRDVVVGRERSKTTGSKVGVSLVDTNWYFPSEVFDKDFCLDVIEDGREGLFLVRDNSAKSGYVLMVNEAGEVVNYSISKGEGAQVIFASKVHQSLTNVMSKAVKRLFKGISGSFINLVAVAPGGEQFNNYTTNTTTHNDGDHSSTTQMPTLTRGELHENEAWYLGRASLDDVQAHLWGATVGAFVVTLSEQTNVYKLTFVEDDGLTEATITYEPGVGFVLDDSVETFSEIKSLVRRYTRPSNELSSTLIMPTATSMSVPKDVRAIPSRARAATTDVTMSTITRLFGPPTMISGWTLFGTNKKHVDVYLSYCGKDWQFAKDVSAKIHQHGLGRVSTFLDDISLVEYKIVDKTSTLGHKHTTPRFTHEARNVRYTAMNHSAVIVVVLSAQGILQYLKKPKRYHSFYEECEWALRMSVEGSKKVLPILLKSEPRQNAVKGLVIKTLFEELANSELDLDGDVVRRFKDVLLKLEALPNTQAWDRGTSHSAAQSVLQMLKGTAEQQQQQQQQQQQHHHHHHHHQQQHPRRSSKLQVLMEREFRIVRPNKLRTKIFFVKLWGDKNGSTDGRLEFFNNGTSSKPKGVGAASDPPDVVLHLKDFQSLEYDKVPEKAIDCIKLSVKTSESNRFDVYLICASALSTLQPWGNEIERQCGVKFNKPHRHSLNDSFKNDTSPAAETNDDDDADFWGGWRIDRTNVEIEIKIGDGAYGEVFSGILHGTGDKKGFAARVAIKSLKIRDAAADFLKEAQVMMELRHQNLVNFYGVVDKGDPMYLVTELCSHGSLKDYLTRGNTLQLPATLRMSYEIASGMQHLETCGFVHRDLALRNVLLDDMIAKVADFGLARVVSEGIYQAKEDARCSIRWTSPEAMNFGLFTSKSDVWSFGITVFELMTCGDDPYKGLLNFEVVNLVDGGGRLSRPNSIPSTVFDALLETWQTEAVDRPSFDDLTTTFQDLCTLLE